MIVTLPSSTKADYLLDCMEFVERRERLRSEERKAIAAALNGPRARCWGWVAVLGVLFFCGAAWALLGWIAAIVWRAI